MGASASKSFSKLVIEVSAREHPVRGFVGRKDDLLKMLQYIASRPTGILAMAGPSDCGKSSLLEHLVDIWGCEAELALSWPIFYIDCEAVGFGDVRLAIAHMKQELSSFLDDIKKVARSFNLKLSFPGVEASCDIDKLMREQIEAVSNIASLVHLFQKFLKGNPTGRPTIILDEAHVLKAWNSADIQTFMGFFVQATKKDHQCHMILCSSDDFFVSWILGALRSTTMSFFPVGPLSEEDARYLFQMKLASSNLKAVGAAQGDDAWEEVIDTAQPPQTVKISDSDWNGVYHFCGGIPLILERAAEAFRGKIKLTDDPVGLPTDIWKNYQERSIQMELEDVGRGLSPSADSGWTSEEFTEILRLLVVKDHIPLNEVRKQVFKDDETRNTREIIGKMLARNVIHVRFSPGRNDYSDLKLGDKYHRFQVMARNNVHLLAMRRAVQEPEFV